MLIRESSHAFLRRTRRYFKDLESPAPSQQTSTTASLAGGPEYPTPRTQYSSSSGKTEAQSRDAEGLAGFFTLFTHY
jgi:hypothetical protein